MPYLKCLVFGCSNTSQCSKLYAFPKDAQLAKEWLKLCGQPTTSNRRTRRVCSGHFTENDYVEDSSKSGSSLVKVLKQNCVPTLFLPEISRKKIKVEPGEPAPGLSVVNQQQGLILDDNVGEVKIAETPPNCGPPVQRVKVSRGPKASSNQPKPSTSQTFPTSAVVDAAMEEKEVEEKVLSQGDSSLCAAVLGLSEVISSLSESHANLSYSCLEARVSKFEGQIRALFGIVNHLKRNSSNETNAAPKLKRNSSNEINAAPKLKREKI